MGFSSHLGDAGYYKNYFREYSIAQLSSWADAYEKCTVIIYSLDSDIAGSHNSAFYYADRKSVV